MTAPACPNCRQTLKPGDDICENCGAVLTPAPARTTAAPAARSAMRPAPHANTLSVCPNCHQRISQSDDVCEHCGVVLDGFASATQPGTPADGRAPIAQCPSCHAPRQPTIGAAWFDEPDIPDYTIGDRMLAAGSWPLGSMKDTLGCFNTINRGYLDRAYDEATAYLGFSLAAAAVSSLAFCAALLFANWRMATTTHRVINLGLIVALLLGVGECAVVVSRFAALGGSQGTFKQLVRDSYDSVYYTAILKRVGTAANADESRWLVATQFGDQAGADGWFKSWQANTAEVQTYIDRAIANETYPEEREPLSVIQRDWKAYYALDAQIRRTAAASGVVAAEGVSTGPSNQAFYSPRRSIG